MLLAFSLGGFIAGCNNGALDTDTGETGGFSALELDRLEEFAGISTPKPDSTNQWADDPAAAHFGQFLFFDKRLSNTGEFSCATCHDPAHGFSDKEQLSEAAGTTSRHSPTLLNSAYQDFFFWDGRADSHWSQALGPLEDLHEQATSRLAIAHLLQDDADLNAAYTSVFGALPDLDDTSRFPAEGMPVEGDPTHPLALAWAGMSSDDQEDINTLFVHVGKAIAAYERKLIRTQAPFDSWVEEAIDGNPDSTLLSQEAKAGLKLFLGEGKCHFCHSGPNFSNNAFHNIGLEDRDWMPPFDSGRHAGISSLLDNPFNGGGRFSDDRVAGSLKIDHLVQGDAQLGAFKTPSLRNLLETAPYIHGGRFETLEAVVESYSDLDEFPSVGHREELMKKLEWEDSQVQAMVAFLESLEGEPVSPELEAAPDSPLLPEGPDAQ